MGSTFHRVRYSWLSNDVQHRYGTFFLLRFHINLMRFCFHFPLFGLYTNDFLFLIKQTFTLVVVAHFDNLFLQNPINTEHYIKLSLQKYCLVFVVVERNEKWIFRTFYNKIGNWLLIYVCECFLFLSFKLSSFLFFCFRFHYVFQLKFHTNCDFRVNEGCDQFLIVKLRSQNQMFAFLLYINTHRKGSLNLATKMFNST